jgi:hypothetical protein
MKLHELLAIEGNYETQMNQMLAQLGDLFTKKRHHFTETSTTFQSLTEGATAEVETKSSLQATVAQELERIEPHILKAWGASMQIALTNTKALATITVEDTDITVADVPATALLELEKRLTQLREVLQAIPTLDPAKGFEEDYDHGDGHYRAREVRKNRTQKKQKPLVKYEATKEHPAQVDVITVDEPVGTILEQEWSGMLTPNNKSRMLARADAVIRAVRAARARANQTEVDPVAHDHSKVGPLLDYILTEVF